MTTLIKILAKVNAPVFCMIEKKIPNSRALLFIHIAQMGLILPRWGPRLPSPIPVLSVFFTHLSHTPF